MGGVQPPRTMPRPSRDALFQCRRQRLQLCDEIDTERLDDLDDRERDSGCDQAVFDRGSAGFIGKEFNPFAFQIHNRVLPTPPEFRQARNEPSQSKIE